MKSVTCLLLRKPKKKSEFAEITGEEPSRALYAIHNSVQKPLKKYHSPKFWRQGTELFVFEAAVVENWYGDYDT